MFAVTTATLRENKRPVSTRDPWIMHETKYR